MREQVASLADFESWNYPKRIRHVPPLCAAIGAIVGTLLAQQGSVSPPVGAGLGAALAFLLAVPVLAALD